MSARVMRMLPDDPTAPLATRLLLALWIHPEHAEELGDDAVVEAAAMLRADAHRFPMVAEDYGVLATENEQLRAGVNGTEWENDLLANAPDWLDDDVAQSEIVTQYVRLMEGAIEALQGAWPLLRGCAHDWDPQCARCQWLKPLSDALSALGGQDG